MRDTFKSDFPKFVYFIIFLSAVVSYCIYSILPDFDVNAMYKSKINIIGLQCFHLPVN